MLACADDATTSAEVEADGAVCEDHERRHNRIVTGFHDRTEDMRQNRGRSKAKRSRRRFQRLGAEFAKDGYLFLGSPSKETLEQCFAPLTDCGSDAGAQDFSPWQPSLFGRLYQISRSRGRADVIAR